jgi:excisionase family DNA binding protein
MEKDIQHNLEKMPTRLLNSKEVADILRISTSKAYKLVRCGELAAVHIGKSIRVKPDDLNLFITKNTVSKEDLYCR